MKTIQHELTLEKSTKNKHLYVNPRQAVTAVYIMKADLPTPPPAKIMLTIEELT